MTTRFEAIAHYFRLSDQTLQALDKAVVISQVYNAKPVLNSLNNAVDLIGEDGGLVDNVPLHTVLHGYLALHVQARLYAEYSEVLGIMDEALRIRYNKNYITDEYFHERIHKVDQQFEAVTEAASDCYMQLHIYKYIVVYSHKDRIVYVENPQRMPMPMVAYLLRTMNNHSIKYLPDERLEDYPEYASLHVKCVYND